MGHTTHLMNRRDSEWMTDPSHVAIASDQQMGRMTHHKDALWCSRQAFFFLELTNANPE